MDPARNPYAPGAGTVPPELAGRDALLDKAGISFLRLKTGRHVRGIMLHGLRGVGKTVLLVRLEGEAQRQGVLTARFEATEDRSLPAILAPGLRAALFKLDRLEGAKAAASRAWRAFAGFVKGLRITYQDIEVGLGAEADAPPSSGDLEHDLTELLDEVGSAAAEHGTAFVMLIDELQYVPAKQLSALVMAFHRVQQKGRPVSVIGAGLPQLLGTLGNARSYAERLFEYYLVDKLEREAAIDALCLPAKQEGVTFTSAAVDHILQQTEGYPYFLQEWGRNAWSVAKGPEIDQADARDATNLALAELDAGFFRVRFDRLTPAEKSYLRAMASLGAGPHRSGSIAEVLARGVTKLGPTRSSLISKGMIYSPAHGDTAFTVPAFDRFMIRIMPDFPAERAR